MPARKGNNYAGDGKLIKRALIDACHKSPEALVQMADEVVRKASEGDLPYVQFLADRLDGKPTQEVVQELTVHQHDADIPPQATTVEEWLERHKVGTAAGAATARH